jgi:L-fucose isomerase-like protein
MQKNSNDKIKIGFVPTYRFHYGTWCRKMYEESLKAFKQVKGLQIIAPKVGDEKCVPNGVDGTVCHGSVHTLNEAEAVAEYFLSEKVDGIIICPLDFGDERSSAKVAERVKVPVLLYATKEPPASEDPSLSRVSDSYCGNLSIASALYRRKIAFHYAGLFFPDEEKLIAEVDTFVRAVAVVKGLTNARIGQVGTRPDPFETVGYDESALIKKFGQNVIFREISDITEQAKAFGDNDAKVRKTATAIRNSVAESTVSQSYLLRAAKLELAFKDFWEKERLSAIAIQCWPAVQRLMGLEMCALFGRLTEQRMLTACEADVLGALSMIVSYKAALGETLPHFIDWTIRHREKKNWLLAWHCGNAPVSLADDPSKTALRSRRDMKGELPVPDDRPSGGLYQFQLKSGPVTFCRLAEYDNKWKMLIAPGKIVPSDETLAGTWSWVKVSDHDALYRTLVEEGFIHHASMIHGDQVDVLRLACKFLNVKPVIVE